MSGEETAIPTTICPVCGRDVPDAAFCGVCGADLDAPTGQAAGRPHAYAANPHEHLFQPNVVSTLFPHLPHRRTVAFQVALLAAAVLLLVLGYLRLSGPTIAVAALAVPVVYLLYLYEVEVYEDEPIYIIGVTFGLGIVLGFLWAQFTGAQITRTLLLNAAHQGAPAGRTMLDGVAFPLLAQALMLAGPVVVYLTRAYDEALDGFSFGVSSALGFVLAATLVHLWPELGSGLTAAAPAQTHTFQSVERGLFVPFIYASATGLIAGALWLRRGQRRTLAARGWTTSLWLAIAVAAALQIGLGLVNVFVVLQLRATLIYFLAAVALLFWVRVALHHYLLAEAVESDIGPPAPCSHCHYIVPRMAFCPNCGIATRAAPKTGIGRAGRATR